MIICINYNDAGYRTIARVYMDSDMSRDQLATFAKKMLKRYDEVYIIDIDEPIDKLIDANQVVLEGCRIY